VNKRYEILTTLDLMDGATSAGCGLAELLAGVANGGRRGQSAAATSGARLGLTRPGGIAGGAPSVADGTALVVGGGCGGSSEVEAKLGATDGVTPPATGRRHLQYTESVSFSFRRQPSTRHCPHSLPRPRAAAAPLLHGAASGSSRSISPASRALGSKPATRCCSDR